MMIREYLEARETQQLSPYASISKESKGRDRQEIECDVRTIYQRDRDRILHSKAFRRLKNKTQVFLIPQGDHYRNRLTHTLEVSQIARTVSKALRLNEDLTEAIALGHDLGHTPFGHAGERALNEIHPGGFVHAEQSVRVVERIEKNGKGLNLSVEVRDGIRNHRTSGMPTTLEGQVVRLCDKIAYIHHDMDDAVRAGLLTEEKIPSTLRKLLGYDKRERLNTFICSIIENSMGQNCIIMKPEIQEGMMELRKVMFQYVYNSRAGIKEEKKVFHIIKCLYQFYIENPEKMSGTYREMLEEGEVLETVVCDYISGMTDPYCMNCFQNWFLPKAWEKVEEEE